MTTFTEEMQLVANELLTEFGAAMTLRKSSTSTYNTDTLTATEDPSTFPMVGAYFDPSNSNITGYEQSLPDDVRLSGKWLYVYSATQIETGDIITHGLRKFKVHAVTSIGPAGTAIIYRVATMEIS